MMELLATNIDLGELIVKLLIAIVLIVISSMASGSEVAFFSLTRADIDDFEERNDAASRRVLSLLEDTDRLLATILVANNMVNICLVIISAQIIDIMLPDLTGVADFLIKTVVVTFILLLFGEIMPKVFTQSNPVKMARMFSMPIKFFRWALYPLAFVLMRTSRHVSRLASKSAEISIEELADAVDLAETGSEEEQKMLSGIISFGNTEVVEIMHSRVDITGIEFDADYDAVRKVIVETGYSRIPVYGDDLDDVRGVLYVKDLLPHISEGRDFEWQRLLRKPYFVPEHMMIDDLLKAFQKKKIHIAIVVDEYGATQGLVSLEDVLEEVVGEITDESDDEERLYEKIGENTYIFDAKIHIGEFERALGFDEDTFSDVEGHAETLAGLMMELKRDLPRRGDELSAHGVRFFIATMDGRRVDKVKVEVDG